MHSNDAMIQIDGSYGEGGGQVLRTSLALSILTGKPVHLENIRAKRSKPGLQPQHLKSVDAAAAVSRAEVKGAALHSTDLVFIPGELRSGRYKFDIGTAGSTSLVLQTVYLPLSLAGSASTVIITGGTHVPKAPCYHYLELHWLPLLRKIGLDIRLTLDEAGFYPQGGGRISATIRPVTRLASITLEERGLLSAVTGVSAVANLDVSIADRQKRQAMGRILERFPSVRIKSQAIPSRFKGTLLLLQAAYDNKIFGKYSACCFYGLGELHKPAERVADEAVDAMESFIATDATIDQYLADQLLLPLYFAEGDSRYRTARVTQHLITNAWVIQTFTDSEISIDGDIGSPGWVNIHPTPRNSQMIGFR